jgi:hypothetical protein
MIAVIMMIDKVNFMLTHAAVIAAQEFGNVRNALMQSSLVMVVPRLSDYGRMCVPSIDCEDNEAALVAVWLL